MGNALLRTKATDFVYWPTKTPAAVLLSLSFYLDALFALDNVLSVVEQPAPRSSPSAGRSRQSRSATRQVGSLCMPPQSCRSGVG